MNIFQTNEPTLAHRNGRTVTVMESRTTQASNRGDNITIYRVRFADGFESVAFEDELTEATARPVEYRDVL